jgi:Glycosyl hydrolase family 30 beta sandwich domain
VYRSAAIREAFGSVGISLGLLSVGMVETPRNALELFGQRANDDDDPFTMNATGFNFTGSALLRDAILTPASAFGYDDLGLGEFVNLLGPLDWLKPIRAANYQRYLDEVAEHVLAIMVHWRDTYGLTPRLLHLFNEPTSGSNELAGGSIPEIVDIVRRVGDRLRDAGFGTVKFVVPNEETIARSREVAQAVLANAGARPYVGVIGYHPYPYGSAYASPRRILATSGNGTPDPEARQQLEQLRALGRQYNVRVWMTEVSEGPGNNDFPFDAIDNVLARAIHIHDNFEYAGASAYFGMSTLWDSQTHQEHFRDRGNIPFLSEQSGMVLVDVGAGQIRITGMGYAVGQYARWAKPGSIRIGATSPAARVIVTAFRDAARQRIVVVAVNNETTPQNLRIKLVGAAAAGMVTGEASYESVRWQPIPDFATTASDELQYLAPARSVVTLAIPLRSGTR